MAAAPPPYGQPPAPYGQPPPYGYPPPGMMPPPGFPGVAFYPPAGVPTMKQRGADALALRIVAIFIDGIIVGVVAFFLGFLWGYLGPIGGFIGYIFNFVLFTVYMLVMEGSRGQTIGKMLLNLKVVREDGGPVTMKEAQARAVGILWWALLVTILLDLIWVADEGQRLGDKWAHTTVIKVS